MSSRRLPRSSAASVCRRSPIRAHALAPARRAGRPRRTRRSVRAFPGRADYALVITAGQRYPGAYLVRPRAGVRVPGLTGQ